MAEDLDITQVKRSDYANDDEDGGLDDSKSPKLPEELKDENRKRPLNRFLVDPELEEDEEGESWPELPLYISLPTTKSQRHVPLPY